MVSVMVVILGRKEFVWSRKYFCKNDTLIYMNICVYMNIYVYINKYTYAYVYNYSYEC